MRILILGVNQSQRYNRGHQLFKDEIALQSNARFYGQGHKFWDPNKLHINQIMRMLEFVPDVIVTYMGKYCRWIKGLDEVSIPKAHIVIDYFPWNYADEDDFIVPNKIDLVLPVCTHEVRAMRRRLKNEIIVQCLPFSVDTDFFRCRNSNRSYEVTAVMSTVSWCYPTRTKILQVVKGKDLNGIVQASWPKTRLWPNDYVAALCQSKITLNGVDSHKSLNWKFLEGPACGAMLLTEAAEDMDKMGFEDGVNCVVFQDPNDLSGHLDYYLENSVERVRIANAGRDLVRKRHGVVARVGEMMDMLESAFEIGQEDVRNVES